MYSCKFAKCRNSRGHADILHNFSIEINGSLTRIALPQVKKWNIRYISTVAFASSCRAPHFCVTRSSENQHLKSTPKASKWPQRSNLMLQVKSGTPIYYVTKFQGTLVSQNSYLRRAPHFCVTHSSKSAEATMASKQPWRPKPRIQAKSVPPIFYMTKFQGILVSQISW